MNNCIGALNQKYFVLFLAYTWLQCALGLGVVAARVGLCGSAGAMCFPGEEGRVTVALVVLAGLAFIFVSSMLYNQVPPPGTSRVPRSCVCVCVCVSDGCRHAPFLLLLAPLPCPPMKTSTLPCPGACAGRCTRCELESELSTA